jgi:hypothetical protein
MASITQMGVGERLRADSRAGELIRVEERNWHDLSARLT